MSQVNVSREQVQNAYNVCKAYLNAVATTKKELAQQMNQISNEWKDSKYKELCFIISDCMNGLDKPRERVELISKSLEKLLLAINEYQTVSVAGGSSDVTTNQLQSSQTETALGTDDKPPQYYAVQKLTGMSDATLSRCEISEDGKTVTMNCINAGKVGMNTKPPYVEKIVDINGVKVKCQAVDFSELSVFETKLPCEMWKDSDDKQFEYCTKQLQEKIRNNPSLMNKFTNEQLEQIKNGVARIKGYTWHHDVECGRMQLVQTVVHTLNRHTGGRAIWGGGRN